MSSSIESIPYILSIVIECVVTNKNSKPSVPHNRKPCAFALLFRVRNFKPTDLHSCDFPSRFLLIRLRNDHSIWHATLCYVASDDSAFKSLLSIRLSSMFHSKSFLNINHASQNLR